MIGGQPPAAQIGTARFTAIELRSRSMVVLSWNSAGGGCGLAQPGRGICAALFYGTGTGVDRIGQHPQVARSKQDLSLERQPDRLVVGPGPGRPVRGTAMSRRPAGSAGG